MAGIGFELQKLLKKGTYLNMVQSYGYASIISSGPWVISILAIIALGFIFSTQTIASTTVQHFQVCITYLIALSLITSSFTHHSYTRYVADRLFEKKIYKIIPNYNGVIFILIIISALIGLSLVQIFFNQQNFYYQLLIICTFIVLNLIWFTTNLLSGLRNYKVIFLVFFLGYSITILLDYYLRIYGINGLLIGFFIGQTILLLSMITILYYYYPSNRLLEFDFFARDKLYISLIFTSFFYNLGIWIDKFIFWYNPSTSEQIIGPLRASFMYDVPIFLAYLAIIPGMAVFLLRIETDFVKQYKIYYNAIRYGDTLNNIIQARYQLINAAKKSIYGIIRIQGLVIVIFLILNKKILSLLHISSYYIYLLNIDIVGVSLLLILLALLNILFYLDRRKTALLLSALFAILNFFFTLTSIHLGVFYFGYGFAMALLVTNIIGSFIVNYNFNHLEYETFMNH